MNNFKVGDTVKRVIDPMNTMSIGTAHKVLRADDGHLWFDGIFGGWSAENFELVESAPEQPKRHKHADLIIAWANGAEIQYNGAMGWADLRNPSFELEFEYRIKPTPKPNIEFVESYSLGDNNSDGKYYALRDKLEGTKVKFTFDGETEKLIAVELVSSAS